jgi:hypothetical protein
LRAKRQPPGRGEQDQPAAAHRGTQEFAPAFNSGVGLVIAVHTKSTNHSKTSFHHEQKSGYGRIANC